MGVLGLAFQGAAVGAIGKAVDPAVEHTGFGERLVSHVSKLGM